MVSTIKNKNKNIKSKTLIDEYFDYHITYEQKYGKNVAVMMQVGAFFECYGIDNEEESVGSVINIAKLLNIQLTRKNKSILENSRKNPLMAGIPLASFKRCIDILINNGLTVVLIEQTGGQPSRKSDKFAREVTKIYSPSTYIDNISSQRSNNLVSIYLDIENDYRTNEEIYIFGLTMMDMTTGKSIIYETNYADGKTPSVYEDVYRFIETYDPSEVIINVKKYNGTEEDLLKIINISSRPYHIKMNKEIPDDIYRLQYQNEFIRHIFNEEKMGFLTPIEYLNLERLQYALISYLLLINFAYEHNKSIVARLDKPELYEVNKYMKLHHNTLYQINVVSNNKLDLQYQNQTQNMTRYRSLFDVINQTSTSMGRRLLREHLLNPITNPEKLNKRYDLIDDMRQGEYIKEYDKYLKLILDVERLHRRMRIGMIQPSEIHSLYQTYQYILSIIDIFIEQYSNENTEKNKLQNKLQNKLEDYEISMSDINEFKDFINVINNTFYIDKIAKYQKENMIESIFMPTIHKEADEIQNKIDDVYKKYDSEMDYFNNKLGISSESKTTDGIIKLKKSDRDGYYLTITNSKLKLISNKLTNKDKDKYTFKTRTKSEKTILSTDIKHYSNKLIIYETKCKSLMKDLFLDTINNYSNTYNTIMRKISNFIAKIDLIKSHAKVSKIFGYCRPLIKEQEQEDTDITKTSSSYIYSKDLRHPIIERNQRSLEYIPNDVDIGRKDKGIVLFGINGSGKSCYMKSIGLSLILAQMGMYVPAKSFTFYPYTNMFTRISGDDNIFRGLSSFAVEMTELRTIINHASSSSLVIGDEVCRGTEETSALAIVAATINMFKEKGINFIFTSHLHRLTKIITDVSFYHLSVVVESNKNNNKNINGSNIVYTRKLTQGSGITKYGLEVASFLIKDEKFIKDAYDIRNELLNEPDKIVNTQKSKYNSNIYVNSCKICGKTYKDTQLDVHHINFQSNCDENDLYNHIPKNMDCNLVVLCKEHHKQLHQNKIKIKGYKYTSNGRELDYELV